MCYINEEIGEIISTISEGKSKIICINDSKDVWDYKIRKEKFLALLMINFPTNQHLKYNLKRGKFHFKKRIYLLLVVICIHYSTISHIF